MHDYLILGAALALCTALPLSWKWQLGMVRAGLVTLAASMIIAVVLAAAGLFLSFTIAVGTLAMWWATVLLGLGALLVLFFRDPERAIPSRPDVIVSPADGQVVYVRPVLPGQPPVASKKGRACPLPELAGTALGDGGAVAVGISMNLSDVHVNRAPVPGRVRFIKRTPGTFGSLRNPEMLARNERVTTLIEAGDLQVALVQIASRLVRRIVTFVSAGEALQLGQRVGAIRLGSQVDLLLPARQDVVLAVQPGDRVLAGRTVMALMVTGPAARRDGPEGGWQATALPADSGPALPAGEGRRGA